MKVKKNTRRKGRITAIANQKGGVGKTTTAHALVAGLTLKGYKALAVDTDPQSNLTYTLKASSDAPGVYELMKSAAKTSETIQHTEQGDIITSSLMLTGADMEFNETGREYLLKEILEPLRKDYDYIIIDSPPTLGILTINALTAADDLIIPLGADAYSVQGFSQLHTTIGKVQKRCNSKLAIAGLLLTKHNDRTAMGRDVRKVIVTKAKRVGAPIFKTVIRESVMIREAQLAQENLYTANAETKNKAIGDYLTFVNEYIKGGKNV
jgi:chromosome partitioning protein